MNLSLMVIGVGLVLYAFLVRMTFLAPTRLGALFYYPNIISDTIWKRGRLPRAASELLGFGLGLICLLASGLNCWILISPLVLMLALLELRNRHRERTILTSIYASKDSRRRTCSLDQKVPTAPGAIPSPSVHPELVINLIGPFVQRLPDYDLGDLTLERTLEIKIIIANHSLVPGQVPITVTVNSGSGLESSLTSPLHVPPLASGDFISSTIEFCAKQLSPGGAINLTIAHADQVSCLRVKYRSIFDPAEFNLVSAEITRFSGATCAAFAWRGDMDLYDTASFQSIQGLSHTLALAARYRFPQTLYLSTRLSLDAAETENYYRHFEVSRGQAQVAEFITWMRENVEFQHLIKYPFNYEKPFAVELGNHMHQHYGTDAAASRENGWRLHAGIGAGSYPWLRGKSDSFSEQRDNALTASRMMGEIFDFTPRSWAMPDSTNDRFTPAAVEAAGCEVLSDANASSMDNVLFQPPPHHPKGTAAVELTKRYPGDPQDFVHYAMILYWIHRAHRLRMPVVFMCHQHLRLFEGYACTHFTEAVMRYVLSQFNGDLKINTVFGIGIYWREVLSPQERKVELEYRDDRIRVRNKGSFDFEDVPVDIKYAKGKSATVLVNLPAGAMNEIDRVGRVSPEILRS